MSYDDNFYNVIREGIQSSAAALVPILLDLFPGTLSVIDVGSGEGHWGAEFLKLGCPDVIGCDGEYVTHPVIPFQPVDLAAPGGLCTIPAVQRFDMAICLEVAEHLPPERADSFIDELCALSDVVVFSAAIPGQTGTNHINCQYQTWWARKFEARGYGCDRTPAKMVWDNDAVEPWYRQDLFVAVAGLKNPHEPVIDVVHPRIWEWKL